MDNQSVESRLIEGIRAFIPPPLASNFEKNDYPQNCFETHLTDNAFSPTFYPRSIIISIYSARSSNNKQKERKKKKRISKQTARC